MIHQPSVPSRPLGYRTIVPAAACAAVAVVLSAQRARHPLHFLLLTGFSLLFVALAAHDAATLRLPNRLTYPGILAALLLCGAWPDHSWVSSLAGGAIGGALMLALFVLLPGFGAGDVKLCLLIGLVLGWPLVLTALFAGVLANGLIAIAGIAGRRVQLRGAMPYGPGLAVGALFVLLIGQVGHMGGA